MGPWKKLQYRGEPVFVDCPQSRTASRENACWYGETVSGATIYAYVGGNPVGRRDALGLADFLFRGGYDARTAQGLSAQQSLPSPSAALGLGGSFGLSANLPTGTLPIGGFEVPTFLNMSFKTNGGHGACYMGWEIGTGANFSIPRGNWAFSDSAGDTSGFGLKGSLSSPGLLGPGGLKGDMNWYANGGGSISGGPAFVGGTPSASFTAGGTITW
jgi:hypothetical protein